MTVPYAAPGRSYWSRVGIAADRLGNAVLGGLDDQTISQSVGLAQLRRRWWARPVALILEVVNWERWHCLNALFTGSGQPIWPERMPPGSPLTAREIRNWGSASKNRAVDVVIWLLLAMILLIIVGGELLSRVSSFRSILS